MRELDTEICIPLISRKRVPPDGDRKSACFFCTFSLQALGNLGGPGLESWIGS